MSATLILVFLFEQQYSIISNDDIFLSLLKMIC